MRKTLITLGAAALLSVPAFAGTALADGNGTAHYGPIASSSPDSGTCGNVWATDSFDREFTVNPKKPNIVTEQFKNGTFVTNVGASPGACETNPGGTLSTVVSGTMHGQFTIVVTNGTYDPAAICTQATCGTTAGFVSTVYGAAASYDVPSYEFHYNAGSHGDWKNASADRGGDRGDITS